jgi:hypothetical protein
MPPLADGNNNDYEDGEQEDYGEGETPEECTTMLHCIFRDFCCPPQLIGWSAGGSNALTRDALAGSEDNDDDDDEGEHEEEEGG